MKVKELIKKLQELDQDKDIDIQGENSHISYSTMEIIPLIFDDGEDEEEEEWIEGYILRPIKNNI